MITTYQNKKTSSYKLGSVNTFFLSYSRANLVTLSIGILSSGYFHLSRRAAKASAYIVSLHLTSKQVHNALTFVTGVHEDNAHDVLQSRHWQQYRINAWAGIVGDSSVGPHVLPHQFTGNHY
jgi:hypothetical protein